nr:MAG TPA: hypothetical protein [Caudoviricetes sp.]DAP79229.1 MAG TPA: hypothetical protein [Caudoviricetes sp.]
MICSFNSVLLAGSFSSIELRRDIRPCSRFFRILLNLSSNSFLVLKLYLFKLSIDTSINLAFSSVLDKNYSSKLRFLVYISADK